MIINNYYHYDDENDQSQNQINYFNFTLRFERKKNYFFYFFEPFEVIELDFPLVTSFRISLDLHLSLTKVIYFPAIDQGHFHIVRI